MEGGIHNDFAAVSSTVDKIHLVQLQTSTRGIARLKAKNQQEVSDLLKCNILKILLEKINNFCSLTQSLNTHI